MEPLYQQYRTSTRIHHTLQAAAATGGALSVFLIPLRGVPLLSYISSSFFLPFLPFFLIIFFNVLLSTVGFFLPLPADSGAHRLLPLRVGRTGQPRESAVACAVKSL